MKNIHGLEDWELEKEIPDTKRKANISIGLKYPDQEQFADLKPKFRIKAIDKIHKDNLDKLVALNLFRSYEITGTKKRPQGVKATILFNALKKLDKLDYISGISILTIDNAAKLPQKVIDPIRFFCVKMTDIIEIEGILNKKHQVEQRFVLIKAKSFDEAYEKIESQKSTYEVRYLNTDGRFVRWHIDSLDDCYETDIIQAADIDNDEGVEVYSKITLKKNKKKTVWDGSVIS